jgi:hypothetical protein
VPGRQQPLHHRVTAGVLRVGGQQLLELVEQQADDAGLGVDEPGDEHVAATAEGLHASRW